YPLIVKSLHNMGRTLIHNFDKSWTEKNAIATLEIMLEDVKDTRKLVRERITKVEGLSIGMVGDAEEQKKDAQKKVDAIQRLLDEADTLDAQAAKLAGEGKTEAARAK